MSTDRPPTHEEPEHEAPGHEEDVVEDDLDVFDFVDHEEPLGEALPDVDPAPVTPAPPADAPRARRTVRRLAVPELPRVDLRSLGDRVRRGLTRPTASASAPAADVPPAAGSTAADRTTRDAPAEQEASDGTLPWTARLLDPERPASSGAPVAAGPGAGRGRRVRTAVVLGTVALAVVLVAVLVTRTLLAGQDNAAVAGDEVTFTVHAGETLDSVAERLDKAGIVASAAALKGAAEEAGDTRVGAGDFVLRERMPAADALAVLQGTSTGAAHYVVVERGQRLGEVLDALTSSTGLSREQLDAAVEDPTRYGAPASAPSLEGWFDTGDFRIPVDASAEDVVAELVKGRLALLEQRGVTDPQEQERVLTVASILEAEALPADYGRVAGVIENRLAPDSITNGLLQVDSTVNYGLGVRNLQFTAAERADESNAYNTYQHPGLPPGPIGMPSDAAIDGALNPVPSDDYFWVTTDIATGHTEFSSTYEEHLVHQQEFRDYCAQNPDVCS